jgi:hypothetical protein
MKAKTSPRMIKIMNDPEQAQKVAEFMRSKKTYENISFDGKNYTISKMPFSASMPHIKSTVTNTIRDFFYKLWK